MALNFTVNLLSGIPIPDYQDIGDSLPIINKAFDDLDTRVLLISTNAQQFKTLTSMVSTADGGTNYFLTNYITSIPEDYLVYLDGVKQLPYADYSINNSLTSIVFSNVLTPGIVIEVIRPVGIVPTIEDPTKLSRTGGALTGDLTGTNAFFQNTRTGDMQSNTCIFNHSVIIPTTTVIDSPAISILKQDSRYLNTGNIEMFVYGYDSQPSLNSVGGGLFFKRANGTHLAPTATLSGRTGYIISSTTHNGNQWKNSSAINFGLEDTPTVDVYKSYISFETLSGSYNTPTNEAMRITSSGNVGIGGLPFAGRGFKSLTINSPASGGRVDLQKDGTQFGAVYSNGPDLFDIESFGSNTSLRFNTNLLERVRITPGGNVGIDTALPNEKLTVSGSISSNGTIYGKDFNFSPNLSSNAYIAYDDNIQGPYLQILGVSGAYIDLAPTFNNLSNGSLSDFGLRLGSWHDVTAGRVTNFVNSNKASLSLVVEESTRMVITTAGNVGVGTTSPNTLLTIAGDLSATGRVFGRSTNLVPEYTAVGNASACIFASAVCFINGLNGNWTAPEGCYTARVTVVAGGGGTGDAIANPTNGGRSHFNYTNNTLDVNPSQNQLFAEGGESEAAGGFGGRAGWNGYTIATKAPKLDTGVNIEGGAGGKGVSGNGGYGGGGGAGGYSGGATNTGKGGGGGSFGRGGNPGTGGGAGGGGSGGILGNGGNGCNGSDNSVASGGGGYSAGGMQLSPAANKLSNFQAAIAQSPGQGADSALYEGGSGGGGWCSAIVSTEPGATYSYQAGVAGTGVVNGSYGMVVIEW